MLGTFADIHGPSGATPVSMPPYWTEALCFVCSGLKQWSGRKLDLTDHPWVMMMRGLLLLKPQEARVCSCRGSSAQMSSPSANILKTVLLTCCSTALAASSWSEAATSRRGRQTGEKFSALLSTSARVQGKARGDRWRLKSAQGTRLVCLEPLSGTKQESKSHRPHLYQEKKPVDLCQVLPPCPYLI